MNIIIDKEHILVHAACPFPCCMFVSMLLYMSKSSVQILVHAECPSPFCRDLNMQYGHLHISMDMDMSLPFIRFISYSFRYIASDHIRFASIRFISYSFSMQNFWIRFETNRSESNLEFAISRIFIRFQIRHIRFETNMRGHPIYVSLLWIRYFSTGTLEHLQVMFSEFKRGQKLHNSIGLTWRMFCWIFSLKFIRSPSRTLNQTVQRYNIEKRWRFLLQLVASKNSFSARC
jgi:hypothetical protein